MEFRFSALNRFDTADKSSIVFSGDATRSDNLIKHAKGEDILEHEG